MRIGGNGGNVLHQRIGSQNDMHLRTCLHGTKAEIEVDLEMTAMSFSVSLCYTDQSHDGVMI